MCQGLIAHPAIRCLRVDGCGQTSLSCEALINLIYTVSQLEVLGVNQLNEPDPEPYKLLRQTVYIFCISETENLCS